VLRWRFHDLLVRFPSDFALVWEELLHSVCGRFSAHEASALALIDFIEGLFGQPAEAAARRAPTARSWLLAESYRTSRPFLRANAENSLPLMCFPAYERLILRERTDASDALPWTTNLPAASDGK
jgi:hypothetical protein